MVENQRLYASIGYEETGRSAEAGYDRVFMRKQLIDKPPGYVPDRELGRAGR